VAINRTALNNHSSTTAVETLDIKGSSNNNTMEVVAATKDSTVNSLITINSEDLTTAAGIKSPQASINSSTSNIAALHPTEVAVATRVVEAQEEAKASTTPLKRCLTPSFPKDPST
jgi:uncharacterized protein YegL